MSDLANLQSDHTRVVHGYERKNLMWVVAIVAVLLALWIFVDFKAMAGVALIGIATQAITISYQNLIMDSGRAVAMSHLYVGLKDRLDEQGERLTQIENDLAVIRSQSQNRHL